MTIESDFEPTRKDSAASVQPNAASPCAEYKIGPGFLPKNTSFGRGNRVIPKELSERRPHLLLTLEDCLRRRLRGRSRCHKGKRNARSICLPWESSNS